MIKRLFAPIVTILGSAMLVLTALTWDAQPLYFIVTTTQYDAIYLLDANRIIVRDLEGGSRPAWSANGKWLFFEDQSWEQPQPSFSRFSIHEAQPYRLPEHEERSLFRPMPSPDGEWIAFESQVAMGPTSTHYMRSDGTVVRFLTQDAVGFDWSSDSKWFTYIADGSLYIQQPEHYNTIQQLTFDPALNAIFPFWSWDRRWIFFLSARNRSLPAYDYMAFGTIYRIQSDGSNLEQLTSFYTSDLQLSPDGQWLTFMDYSGALFRMKTDGSQLLQLSPQHSMLIPIGWSADQQWIFCVPDFSAIYTDAIYRVRADGSQIEWLTATAHRITSETTALSPDRQWIAYTDNYSQLYKIRTNGSEKTLLFEVSQWTEIDHVVWSPPMHKERRPAISIIIGIGLIALMPVANLITLGMKSKLKRQ